VSSCAPATASFTPTRRTRGGDLLLGTYNYLDLTPLGRQFHVGEVLYHDKYDTK
jgi:predicted dithiol-disulfide oxidoreductase (DUF899 family)